MIKLEKDDEGYFLRLPETIRLTRINENVYVLIIDDTNLKNKIEELEDELREYRNEFECHTHYYFSK